MACIDRFTDTDSDSLNSLLKSDWNGPTYGSGREGYVCFKNGKNEKKYSPFLPPLCKVS